MGVSAPSLHRGDCLSSPGLKRLRHLMNISIPLRAPRAVGLSSLCSMSPFKVAIETVGILITCRPWIEKDESDWCVWEQKPYTLTRCAKRRAEYLCMFSLSFRNCVVRQSGALQGINIPATFKKMEQSGWVTNVVLPIFTYHYDVTLSNRVN